MQASSETPRHSCEEGLSGSVRCFDLDQRKRVFVYVTSVFSHFSPPTQNRGLFMAARRGRVSLTAEIWPSDKDGSLQALTGNGARAKAPCCKGGVGGVLGLEPTAHWIGFISGR